MDILPLFSIPLLGKIIDNHWIYVNERGDRPAGRITGQGSDVQLDDIASVAVPASGFLRLYFYIGDREAVEGQRLVL